MRAERAHAGGMRRRWRQACLGCLAVFALQQGVAARPPSSLRPPPSSAKLWFHHHHRIVSSCTPTPKATTCTASFTTRDSSTEVWLVPLSAPGPSSLRDERAPIRVLVGPTATRPVEAAAGRWGLAWQGYATRELRLEPDGSMSIALQTTTGRCGRVSGKCRLQADVTTRSAVISTR